VGEKNKGIYYIMEALDFERISIATGLERDFREVVAYTREAGKGRSSLIRQKLADLATEVEAGKILALRVAWMINNGKIPKYEAAMLKMIITETRQKLVNTSLQIMGLDGLLRQGEKMAPLAGKYEWLYRDSLESLVTRGTSEIMRNIIAQRGLGLPRD
jgi:alkylation response protein AidB-like acyl-CoA dehydrogenase